MTCGRHFCDSRQQRVHMSKFAPVAKAPVRIHQNILARSERRLLNWLCARLPAWVPPDQLPPLGFAASVLVPAGYLLSWFASQCPGLSPAGSIGNWFVDSVARTPPDPPRTLPPNHCL